MTYLMAALIVVGALAAVAWPLFRRDPTDPVVLDDAALEHRITSYRTALQNGTVCNRCLRDNPADAKFCLECGLQLSKERKSDERGAKE
ncbi:MAG: zinc ribbon domain-containing protein [Gemmatimonadota bacterium]